MLLMTSVEINTLTFPWLEYYFFLTSSCLGKKIIIFNVEKRNQKSPDVFLLFLFCFVFIISYFNFVDHSVFVFLWCPGWRVQMVIHISVIGTDCEVFVINCTLPTQQVKYSNGASRDGNKFFVCTGTWTKDTLRQSHRA